MRIAQLAPTVLFGSALSALGFSLGKDIYKGGKNSAGGLIGILIVLLLAAGIYYGGVIFSRNYKSTIGELTGKVSGALLVVVASFFVFHISRGIGLDDTQSLLTIAAILVLGLVNGFLQRGPRLLAWEAEFHNDEFLSRAGLIQIDDENLPDALGNRFRLDEVAAGMMEFMVLKRRGRRAFLQFDESGKFTHWSGVVKLGEGFSGEGSFP